MRLGVVLLLLTGVIAFIEAKEKVITCYYGSWAVYRQGNGKFDVEDLRTDLCTHIIFTFLGLNSDGTIRILDPWNEIDKRAIERFAGLKSRNPNVKLIIAIGGWNEGSEKYSTVTNNDALRAVFVNDIVKFVKKYKLDGFDLDWEYPADRGGIPSDRQSFVKLINDLRPHFDENGWVLTAAVGATKDRHLTTYDVPALSKGLDYIHVMTYDLHGSWDGKTGQNSPLYPSSIDQGEWQQMLNVDACIKGWIEDGADPAKLVVGMGVYGHSYTLANSANHQLGAPTVGGGQSGPWTQQMGFLGYNEMCEKFKEPGWTHEWDDEQKTPIAYKGDQWLGYDNVKSIELKSQYILDKNLAGGMIWSIETDDMHNLCGEGTFPILKAMNRILRNYDGGNETTPVPPPTTETPPHQSTTEHPDTGELCQKEGYVRDPNDCTVFYFCTSNGHGGYDVTQYKCPKGTVFDPSINACNWESLVPGC